jgi:hypothetical protein
MMRLRILFAVTLAAAVVLVSTAAGAKGAMEMTLSGPGLAAPLRLANTVDSAVSPNHLAQKSGFFNVHPFVDGGAVTYTRPTDKVSEIRGGWYRAGPELTLLLVAAGVPVPAGCAAPVPVAAEPPLTG